MDWASEKRFPAGVLGSAEGHVAIGAVDPGVPGMILGHEISARAQVELLALLRLNEEALEEHLAGEQARALVGDAVGFEDSSEDPFGFDGGDFDAA